MTSVRPKLKDETPKGITAWDTLTGAVVYLRQDGGWTRDPSQIGVFTGKAGEAALAAAQRQEDVITDPYFMELTERGEISGRETLRETIRAQGPSIGVVSGQEPGA